ncbi:conserved hypothetical protein [Arthrobacter sp. Hiyo6]|nr:conserved hypothetical protein [Arthrobacter sp. Hiyo6]
MQRLSVRLLRPIQSRIRIRWHQLTGAGIPAASLQVSASRTPTGLDVDSLEAAALQGKDCVIGQIRDGAVVVTVLPVLANGKCFVGTPA